MLLSIVIPAFNEAAGLSETLANLNRARTFLERENKIQAEIIVVDNDSDDATAEVARTSGATVVFEKQRSIAKARNSGAHVSTGDVLVFVDADTILPAGVLSRIAEAMSEVSCFGGAVDTDYRPRKAAARLYLQ